MDLEFKQDFDLTRENWKRFWEGSLPRPIILAIIPKAGAGPIPPPKWGAAFSQDYESVVDQALRWAETHEFLGDSVPYFTPSLIIDLIPSFLGAEIISIQADWGIDTHAVPFIKDLNSAEIKFQKDSKWWEKWVTLCECLKRKCSGRLVLGPAYPGYNNLDTLASLRGADNLMMDFYDNPDGVHHAMRQVMKASQDVMNEHCRIFEHEFKQYGCVIHHGFYSEGLIGIPQCDFGFNINKKHFDEFALPYLAEEIARLNAAAYHLDGSGNITHVESICSIEKIGVIQWVAGAGNENKDWTGLFEKINGLGKGLWLDANSPEEAAAQWRKYNKSGRMILSVRAETKDDVLRYLESV